MKYQNARQSAAIPPMPPTTPPIMTPVSEDGDAGGAADVPAGMADVPRVELEGEEDIWSAGIEGCRSPAVDVLVLASLNNTTLPCSIAYPLPPTQHARLSLVSGDPQQRLPSAQVVIGQAEAANWYPR